MTLEVFFSLLLDAAAIWASVRAARMFRASKPLPRDNWRPSDDDARSGRRVTLNMGPRR